MPLTKSVTCDICGATAVRGSVDMSATIQQVPVHIKIIVQDRRYLCRQHMLAAIRQAIRDYIDPA